MLVAALAVQDSDIVSVVEGIVVVDALLRNCASIQVFAGACLLVSVVALQTITPASSYRTTAIGHHGAVGEPKCGGIV